MLEETLPIVEIIQLLGEIRPTPGIIQELEALEVHQQDLAVLEEILIIHSHIIEHLEIMLGLLIRAKIIT